MNKGIAPTLICSDLMNIEREVKFLDSMGVSTYHVDIMDGSFVPNYAFSFDIIPQLKRITKTPIDVHLMTTHLDRDVSLSIKRGADSIAFHPNGDSDESLIKYIKENGKDAGIVFSPNVEIEKYVNLLEYVDYVIVMGVNPGFSGQRFLPCTLDRISILNSIREKEGLPFTIMVDGGIDENNAIECLEHGADTLVSGALCIFKDLSKIEENTSCFLSKINSGSEK